jgi:acyl-CoA thioesterase-1
LLQKELLDRGQQVEVINQGIGGERTDQALGRLGRDILSLEPAVVLVMYGTNDSYVDKGQQQSRLSKDQYEQNLRIIVRELQRLGIQSILMTEPCWGDEAVPNGVGENPNVRLEPFVQSCRAVAGELKVPLVDHFAHWSEAGATGTDISDWTTDECHPNPAGHKVLADSIFPVLFETLRASGSLQ